MDLKFNELPYEIEKGNLQLCLQTKILLRDEDEEHKFMKLDNIKIPEYFRPVSIRKKYNKLIHFLRAGEFIDEIIIDKNNILIDGYSTYTILREFKIDEWIVKKVN